MSGPRFLQATPALAEALDAAARAVQAAELDYESALSACVGMLLRAEADPSRRIIAVVAIVEALSAAAIRAAIRDTDPHAMRDALAAGRFDPWIGRPKRKAMLDEIGAVAPCQHKENVYAERC